MATKLVVFERFRKIKQVENAIVNFVKMTFV